MPTQNMNSYFQQGAPNPGGTGNPGGVYNSRGGGFSYGGGGMYADQNPNLGRYRPPMMSDGGNPNSWMDYGGYAYNSPNSYGRPYGGYGFRPQYGQRPPQYGGSGQQYGGGPQMPQGYGLDARPGFGYGYGGKRPYGTDPGAAAYGDEGLRRFQAQQQAQMMDPMAQWRALMTGSGSGGNVRQVADYFAAYMANPDQTQSYGGDARRPVAYGGGPTNGGGLDPQMMGRFGDYLGQTSEGQSYGGDARPPVAYGGGPTKGGGYAKPMTSQGGADEGFNDFDWNARNRYRRFRGY